MVERRETCKEGCVAMTEKVNDKAGELYSAINKRPTWTIFWSIVGVLLIMIIGAYAYTTLSNAAMKADMKDDRIRQESLTLQFRNEMRESLAEIKQDLKEIKQ